MIRVYKPFGYRIGDKLVDSQQHQTTRVLLMYERLRNGQSLTKKAESDFFNVGEKTIQRDFNSIRSFLETLKIGEYLEYDRKQKVYKLETIKELNFHSEEVLAIVKVLIESRAFPKDDMDMLINKLTELVQPGKRDFIRRVMSNEKYLYVDLHHKRSIFTLLLELAQAVHYKQLLKIRYKKEFDDEDRERIIKPVGLIFSKYYFYLIAYQTTVELEFPTIYRVDRITVCQVREQHFKIPYSDRFQEGEFRKRIQFMHAGELMTIRFRYSGLSPQAVLDRLPTALIILEDEDGIVFKAEVFGQGIKMWLLSQGEFVEVLEPLELRAEMRKSVEGMLGRYREDQISRNF